MKATITTIARIAMVAAVAAVGGLTSMSFVQNAEAASCQAFFEGDTGFISQKCSSDNSFDHANSQNFGNHVKNVK
jgi:hypothetical protein